MLANRSIRLWRAVCTMMYRPISASTTNRNSRNHGYLNPVRDIGPSSGNVMCSLSFQFYWFQFDKAVGGFRRRSAQALIGSRRLFAQALIGSRRLFAQALIGSRRLFAQALIGSRRLFAQALIAGPRGDGWPRTSRRRRS